jgi:hypothetical protein
MPPKPTKDQLAHAENVRTVATLLQHANHPNRRIRGQARAYIEKAKTLPGGPQVIQHAQALNQQQQARQAADQNRRHFQEFLRTGNGPQQGRLPITSSQAPRPTGLLLAAPPRPLGPSVKRYPGQGPHLMGDRLAVVSPPTAVAAIGRDCEVRA